MNTNTRIMQQQEFSHPPTTGRRLLRKRPAVLEAVALRINLPENISLVTRCETIYARHVYRKCGCRIESARVFFFFFNRLRESNARAVAENSIVERYLEKKKKKKRGQLRGAYYYRRKNDATVDATTRRNALTFVVASALISDHYLETVRKNEKNKKIKKLKKKGISATDGATASEGEDAKKSGDRERKRKRERERASCRRLPRSGLSRTDDPNCWPPVARRSVHARGACVRLGGGV
ncbi:hypothetical protein PUN28_015889 [Cardiocondyla obscurior]|uniref:Uncharacterized protein n=1 Tax=Cardiocondyla obscurior TaxID=286306 RepID=A0AAW2EU91_9HYME